MNEITMNTALSASNTLAANGRNPGIEDKTNVRESKTEKVSTTIRPPAPEKPEEKRFDFHVLESFSEMDYLKNYPQEYFPEYMAIELENSLAEQLKIKEYLETFITL